MAEYTGTRITRQELFILQCLANGLEQDAIAERMFLSVNTVKTHRRNLYRKMRATNAPHAVALAFEWGWLKPPGCCLRRAA